MDLQISGELFLVCGAGSGFGKAISLALAREGARVLAVSRTEPKLLELEKTYPEKIETITGDLYSGAVHDLILNKLEGQHLSGAVINAGGPPAGGFFEVSMDQWEAAWASVVRWKIALTRKLIPIMQSRNYGRLLFIESVSVKQPVDNLILSNALRPAMVGFAKTLSREVAGQGINVNVLAPGMHTTPALERLFIKKSELENISMQQARKAFEADIPVGKMATADEMSTLALYLLSPISRYLTGQTITHDGGAVKGIFG